MPQRRDYIDELKGLGILLVVLGHFIEQYRMRYSFVSASFFCIYAFHMALFCICSGLVARFNPRKLVTQQLWLYLVGQTLMLAFRAAVLRENFAETGGLLAAWLLPWRHIWYLYALIFWHLTLPVLCRLRDRLGLAGSCLGMALAVGLALAAGWWTGPSRWCGYLHSTRFMRAGCCSARSWTGWPRLRRSTARCGLWLRRGWRLAMERIFSGCCGLTRSWTTARSCSTM